MRVCCKAVPTSTGTPSSLTAPTASSNKNDSIAMWLIGDYLRAWENPDKAARAGIQALSAVIDSICEATSRLGTMRDNLAGPRGLFAAD